MQTSKTKKKSSKISDISAEIIDANGQTMTTDIGVKINDDHNSLKVGDRGATLLEDFILREKLTHFDRERIPERVVHARGTGAHGVFKLYKSLSKYTKAAFLNDTAIETPVFVRFSTVAGFRGSSDLARDVRGFSVKFYTTEGNYDLVGNNIPVFFIQDSMKFPDLVHAVKPEPNNEIPQAASAHDTFWDFISLMPESAHMIMWAMSDRTLPRSFRMMEGFGVHTFRLVNAKGESHFVKFHWKPVLGVHSVAWDEAQKISGKDPDFHRRDLWEAIEDGNFPEWEFGVQIIPEKDEHKFDFDLLDPTKLIPEEIVPVEIIGKMTLNRNVENFFAETEQVAFHPGNIVPGIDFTNDPLLQGRLFSYTDTHLHRLGSPNFTQLPINRPLQTAYNNHRDGQSQHNVHKGQVAYSPNSLGGGCPYMAKALQGGFVSYDEKIDAHKIRARSRSFFDHFSQAILFYNSQSNSEKQHIKDALSFELSMVKSSVVRERMVKNLTNIDLNLSQYVADKLGLPKPTKVEVYENGALPADANPKEYASVYKGTTLTQSVALSMQHSKKDTIKSRQIAVFIADGFDDKSLVKFEKTMSEAGAKICTIAPKLGKIKSIKGKDIVSDKTFFNSASVLFDAVYIVGGEQCINKLCNEMDAIHFVNEAFKHCKVIGGDSDAEKFFKLTYIGNSNVDEGIIKNSDLSGFINAVAQHRFWEREAARKVPA